MPAYSFKERFIPMLKNGSKRQTIRKKRKGQAKPGDTVYLYYAMRTKYCTKIGEGVCTKVSDIIILATGVFIDGKLLTRKRQFETLAKADGFESWEIMMRWWQQTHSLPFNGDIIFWDRKENNHEQIKN